MQDVYAVLREKELAIERVRREIEALRVVCQLVTKEEDPIPDTIRILESNTEPEEKTMVVSPAEEKKAALAQIRARFLDSDPRETRKETGASVLVQFRQSALIASQVFLKRVRDSRLWQGELQRNAIRDLFGRSARSNAA
jgi:hypothetical protein